MRDEGFERRNRALRDEGDAGDGRQRGKQLAFRFFHGARNYTKNPRTRAHLSKEYRKTLRQVVIVIIGVVPWPVT